MDISNDQIKSNVTMKALSVMDLNFKSPQIEDDYFCILRMFM